MKFEKTVFTFLTEIHKFDHGMSCLDLVWDIIFPDSKGRWFKVGVTKYRETYYISHIDGDTCGIEAVLNESVKEMDQMGMSTLERGRGGLESVWAPIIRAAMNWIDGKHPRRSVGGHPWEIKRGGNTTHIDLCVHRPSYGSHEKFRIELRGESIGRLKETIRMFLAIQETGMPISIADPEGIRRRLLGQDNIGIVPSYNSLHRANQRFREEQHVYDVLHYGDLGRQKRRVLPFIAWEPLTILKPKGI